MTDEPQPEEQTIPEDRPITVQLVFDPEQFTEAELNRLEMLKKGFQSSVDRSDEPFTAERFCSNIEICDLKSLKVCDGVCKARLSLGYHYVTSEGVLGLVAIQEGVKKKVAYTSYRQLHEILLMGLLPYAIDQDGEIIRRQEAEDRYYTPTVKKILGSSYPASVTNETNESSKDLGRMA